MWICSCVFPHLLCFPATRTATTSCFCCKIKRDYTRNLLLEIVVVLEDSRIVRDFSSTRVVTCCDSHVSKEPLSGVLSHHKVVLTMNELSTTSFLSSIAVLAFRIQVNFCPSEANTVLKETHMDGRSHISNNY
jgi:hypothetical protein